MVFRGLVYCSGSVGAVASLQPSHSSSSSTSTLMPPSVGIVIAHDKFVALQAPEVDVGLRVALDGDFAVFASQGIGLGVGLFFLSFSFLVGDGYSADFGALFIFLCQVAFQGEGQQVEVHDEIVFTRWILNVIAIGIFSSCSRRNNIPIGIVVHIDLVGDVGQGDSYVCHLSGELVYQLAHVQDELAGEAGQGDGLAQVLAGHQPTVDDLAVDGEVFVFVFALVLLTQHVAIVDYVVIVFFSICFRRTYLCFRRHADKGQFVPAGGHVGQGEAVAVQSLVVDALQGFVVVFRRALRHVEVGGQVVSRGACVDVEGCAACLLFGGGQGVVVGAGGCQ